MLCWDSYQRAGKNLGWLGSARRDALCDERRRLNLGSRLGAQVFVGGGEKAWVNEFCGLKQFYVM